MLSTWVQRSSLAKREHSTTLKLQDSPSLRSCQKRALHYARTKTEHLYKLMPRKKTACLGSKLIERDKHNSMLLVEEITLSMLFPRDTYSHLSNFRNWVPGTRFTQPGESTSQSSCQKRSLNFAYNKHTSITLAERDPILCLNSANISPFLKRDNVILHLYWVRSLYWVCVKL